MNVSSASINGSKPIDEEKTSRAQGQGKRMASLKALPAFQHKPKISKGFLDKIKITLYRWIMAVERCNFTDTFKRSA